MKRRSSLRLIGWPIPPTSGDVRQSIFASLLYLCGSIPHGFDDVLVSGATAEISGNSPANLLFAGIRIRLEQSIGRHQHAWSAITALQAMLFFETFLQRMKLAVLYQAFNGQQFAAVGLHREHCA